MFEACRPTNGDEKTAAEPHKVTDLYIKQDRIMTWRCERLEERSTSQSTAVVNFHILRNLGHGVPLLTTKHLSSPCSLTNLDAASAVHVVNTKSINNKNQHALFIDVATISLFGGGFGFSIHGGTGPQRS